MLPPRKKHKGCPIPIYHDHTPHTFWKEKDLGIGFEIIFPVPQLSQSGARGTGVLFVVNFLREMALFVRGSSGAGVQEHAELIERVGIIFPPPAHIANPGGEIRDRDQFVTQPGEVSDIMAVHLACLAFITGDSIAIGG